MTEFEWLYVNIILFSSLMVGGVACKIIWRKIDHLSEFQRDLQDDLLELHCKKRELQQEVRDLRDSFECFRNVIFLRDSMSEQAKQQVIVATPRKRGRPFATPKVEEQK